MKHPLKSAALPGVPPFISEASPSHLFPVSLASNAAGQRSFFTVLRAHSVFNRLPAVNQVTKVNPGDTMGMGQKRSSRGATVILSFPLNVKDVHPVNGCRKNKRF